MFVYIIYMNADTCTAVPPTYSKETVTLAVPEVVSVVNPLAPGDCYKYNKV